MVNLTAHYSSRHSDKLIPGAENCIELLKNTKKLQQQRSKNKGKVIRTEIECSVCGEHLSGRFNLNRHVKRKHSNSKDRKRRILSKYLNH